MSATTKEVSGNCDSVAALRFLAAAIGQFDNAALSSEEAYGMEALLRMLADRVEGSAA
jgi:hypothetical protein